MKKKVLIFANYYAPDKSAMARLMTDLAEGLAREFDVYVICTVPSYADKIDEQYKKKRFYKTIKNEVKIIKVRVSENDKSRKIARIRHIMGYFFGAIFAAIKVGKCDAVYATTAPPILGGMLGRIGKIICRSKYVYVLQDLNPEQIEAVGYTQNKFLIWVMRVIDNMSCKAADKLVVIGRDMQDTIDSRFGRNKVNGIYIHNWVNEEEMYPLEKNDSGVRKFISDYKLDNKFVFMYLGNLGLFYDLLGLLNVIENFKNNEDVRFVFVGTGALEEKMKMMCSEKNMENVVFVPYKSGKELLYAMNAADVHLVTNAKGIKGVSVPSKIYGVMAVNKPVLCILEKDSEVWKVVKETGNGYACETGCYEEIERTIAEIIMNKDEFCALGANGRNALLEKYSKNDSLEKYIELFKSLV